MDLLLKLDALPPGCLEWLLMVETWLLDRKIAAIMHLSISRVPLYSQVWVWLDRKCG